MNFLGCITMKHIPTCASFPSNHLPTFSILLSSREMGQEGRGQKGEEEEHEDNNSQTGSICNTLGHFWPLLVQPPACPAFCPPQRHTLHQDSITANTPATPQYCLLTKHSVVSTMGLLVHRGCCAFVNDPCAPRFICILSSLLREEL